MRLLAQRIPQEVIEDIRQRTNIVSVIEQYVQLRKSGKNYIGLCPFHEERSPSFSVAEDKQIFHCFGCGKGGTVFNFLQEIEGLSFPVAVKKVAELEKIPFDIVIEPLDELVTHTTKKQHELLQLHKKAMDVYHHVLMNTQIGEPALEYLLERGMTKETIQTFKLGFAPQKRDFLRRIYLNEQVTEELLEASGLFIQRDTGELLDRFYQRIMFPINDEHGEVIGFSGRLFQTSDFPGEKMPKYLNSPETSLFNKREVLFNFDKARKDIRKENTVFLLEGFMDVLAAFQSGIPNVVASMGTSLTNEQIRKFERSSEELVLCYDGDHAGVEATNRSITLLSEHSRLHLSVITLPEKLDPDEYAKKYGQEALKELFLHGKNTVFHFKMHYLRLSKNMNNDKEQLDYINELLQELVLVDSALERDRYLNQLAQEFQLSFHSLEEQLRQLEEQRRVAKKRPSFDKKHAAPSDQSKNNGYNFSAPMPTFQNKLPLTKVQKAERTLLYRLMNEQAIRHLVQQSDFHFAHDQYQEFYLLIDSYMSLQEQFLLASFLDYLKEDEMKRLAIDLSNLVISEESSEREIADVMRVINNHALEELIAEKQRQKKEAERIGNKSVIEELSIEVVRLLQQLQKNRSSA